MKPSRFTIEKCPKCGGTTIIYTIEGGCTVYRCFDCGHKWVR